MCVSCGLEVLLLGLFGLIDLRLGYVTLFDVVDGCLFGFKVTLFVISGV